MVNFKFAKFHCYQQTQSFLITPYNRQRCQLLFLVYLVSASVRKKCGYEKKLLTVVLIVVHRVFYSHFIISLKRYDMVVLTFLYIIIILCCVNNLNNSMSNFRRSLGQPQKQQKRI
jgi:hypothetical protein